MSRRKAWEDLSPAYRERLKRNGINRRAHSGGVSLAKATGHKEREKPVPNLKADARKYLSEPKTSTRARDELVEEAKRHAYRILGDKLYFDKQETFKRIEKLPEVTLRLMLRADEDRWLKLARPQYGRNPFYYH